MIDEVGRLVRLDERDGDLLIYLLGRALSRLKNIPDSS